MSTQTKSFKPVHIRLAELDASEKNLADRRTAFDAEVSKKNSELQERESRLALAEMSLAKQSQSVEEREKRVSSAESHVVGLLATLAVQSEELEKREVGLLATLAVQSKELEKRDGGAVVTSNSKPENGAQS